MVEPPGGAAEAEAEAPPRRGRGRGIVVAMIVVGAAIGVMWAAAKVLGGTGLPADPTGLRPPTFEMPVLGGSGSLALADLKGKPVVINFWASWCVPCKEEAPTLAAAERKWRSKGVVFLGIDSEDKTEPALGFIRTFGIGYRSVFDPQGRLELKYGVTGFPETFFVGRDGVITAKYVGPIDAASLQAYVSAIASG